MFKFKDLGAIPKIAGPLKKTVFINSGTCIALDELYKTLGDAVDDINGEVRLETIRMEVGDDMVDIAGTVAIREALQRAGGYKKAQANRLMPKMKADEFVLDWHGFDVTCTSSVESWVQHHKADVAARRGKMNTPKKG